jgi:hypothetical protein
MIYSTETLINTNQATWPLNTGDHNVACANVCLLICKTMKMYLCRFLNVDCKVMLNVYLRIKCKAEGAEIPGTMSRATKICTVAPVWLFVGIKGRTCFMSPL